MLLIRIRELKLLVLIPLWVGSLFFVERHIELARKDRQAPPHIFCLFKGKYLKLASLGHEELLADLLWLRALQYIGDKEAEKRGYPHLYPLLDIITDLDPRFSHVYEAGGVVLSIWARKTEESIKLLEKGFKENPQVWRIPFYLGFNYFFYKKDYQRAACYISKASFLPGRPEYLPRLASRLYIEAKRPEVALDFLSRVYENTDSERVKEEISKRIKEVVVERDIVKLESGVALYKEKFGKGPKSLEDLVSVGILSSLPPEPFGGYYYLDHKKGIVMSSQIKERMKIYR